MLPNFPGRGTRPLRAHAAKDPDGYVRVVKLPFPEDGWTCERNDEDTRHLEKDSLLRWLQTTVRDTAAQQAKEFGLHRVLFVTDSTFMAQQYECCALRSIVVIRHLGSERKKTTAEDAADTERDDEVRRLRTRARGR